jgi:hypothetical protein
MLDPVEFSSDHPVPDMDDSGETPTQIAFRIEVALAGDAPASRDVDSKIDPE